MVKRVRPHAKRYYLKEYEEDYEDADVDHEGLHEGGGVDVPIVIVGRVESAGEHSPGVAFEPGCSE